MLTGNATLDLAFLHKHITAAVSLFYQAVAFVSTHMPYLDEQWRNNRGWITYALSMVNIVRVSNLSMQVYVEQSSRQFTSARL